MWSLLVSKNRRELSPTSKSSLEEEWILGHKKAPPVTKSTVGAINTIFFNNYIPKLVITCKVFDDKVWQCLSIASEKICAEFNVRPSGTTWHHTKTNLLVKIHNVTNDFILTHNVRQQQNLHRSYTLPLINAFKRQEHRAARLPASGDKLNLEPFNTASLSTNHTPPDVDNNYFPKGMEYLPYKPGSRTKTSGLQSSEANTTEINSR